MVIDSLDNIIKEGYVENKITERLKETINDIVDDSLKSYSDFGKNLKGVISNSINLNAEELSLPEYNQLILNAIKNKLDIVMTNEGIRKIEQDIESLLSGEKKNWKMSELIEKLKEEFSDEARESEWEEISYHEERSNYSSGLNFIYFDHEPNKKSYECEYRLVIKGNRINSVTSGSKKYNKSFVYEKLYGIEKLLFKLFASCVDFELDKVNIYYPECYED